jgi:DNA-binding SARP family transcriptional activator/tetratricopeptide (TPR) repeat protein
MHFGVLGPLQVVAGDSEEPRAVSASRLRALLAVLLWKANRPVPLDELAEMVWDGAPPGGAREAVRALVMRLRRQLDKQAAARIVTRAPGYAIEVSGGELDAERFETLTREAGAAVRAARWAQAACTAAEALALWRGTPLVDVPSQMLRDLWVPRLDQLHVQALEWRIEADLHEGRHDQLIPELRDLAARHRLREHFHGQLMLALVRSGRQAEALAAYQAARRMLADELGIDPSPELRQLHERILAGDASLMMPPTAAEAAQPVPAAAPIPRQLPDASPEAGTTNHGTAGLDVVGAGETAGDTWPGEVADTTATPVLADFAGALAGGALSRTPAEPAGQSPPRPAQLPADIADFTGREAQVSYVCDALTRQDVASDLGTARIAVIAGAAGLGKTTLAVHAAHRVRSLFPDGQLYADLCGASADPVASGEVLARFLRDLGVNGGKVPAGDEERAALYRTRLAGRCVLILLDNAKDAAQVRPLLPGGDLCAVLVTTRNRTAYLVSTGFADLGTLPGSEALDLFSRIAGYDRAAAEPDATAEILTACAGLPLAIRICAARLATRPQWRIATMAARLRDRQRRLDELQVGDLEVRASFQVSYDSLHPGRHRPGPARAFRLLGLWQGQQISLPAAAALAGEREEDVASALETLVDANLLESPAPDWYQYHDLLRLFATERAQAEEPEEGRNEAVARLLRWYLGMAVAAADILSPHRYRIPPDDVRAPGPLPDSAEAALAWYDSERESVIAAIRQAAAAGLHDIAWRLPTALFPLFNRRASWTDCISAHWIAVHSACAAGSRRGEAWALQNLGIALARIGDGEALGRLREALAIRRDDGDRTGEGQTLISLADAYYRIQGPEAAIGDSLRGLEVLRQAGNPALLGIALNNHGEFCLDLGRLDEAAGCFREALGIWKAIGAHGHGHALENLGRMQLESGRPGEAIASLTEAYRLHVASGDLMGQAGTLQHLARAHRDAGQEDQARESLAAALALFEKLKADAEAQAIRSALTALDNLEKPSTFSSVE